MFSAHTLRNKPEYVRHSEMKRNVHSIFTADIRHIVAEPSITWD